MQSELGAQLLMRGEDEAELRAQLLMRGELGAQICCV